MEKDLVQISRTMSYALRHDPESFGLQLDQEGWVATEDLLSALRARKPEWRDLNEGDLVTMMAKADKQRFEMLDGRIRAFYGHSIPTKIVKEPTVPPEILFHGTTSRVAKVVLVEGLKPMERQYVHLSSDKETAVQVGLRRTKSPVILQIAALEAYQQGVKFYLGNDMVWLAESIPSRFISLTSS